MAPDQSSTAGKIVGASHVDGCGTGLCSGAPRNVSPRLQRYGSLGRFQRCSTAPRLRGQGGAAVSSQTCRGAAPFEGRVSMSSDDEDVQIETRNPMANDDDDSDYLPESLERAGRAAEVQRWRNTLVPEGNDEMRENERDRRKRIAHLKLDGAVLLIDPEGLFRRRWDFTQMLLLIYVAFGVPFRLGFGVPVGLWTFWFWFDAFVDIYFVSDIAVSFRTAFYNARGELEVHPVLIKNNYIRSWFIIDLTSCFPGAYISYFFGDDGTSTSKTVKLLRMFRLLKLLRLARFNRLLHRYEEEFYSLMTTFKLGKLVILMGVIGHWLSCLWFWTGTLDSTFTDVHGNLLIGWTYRELGGDSTTNPFYFYAKSFYWAIMTMTTVGYGDIVPSTEFELIVAIVGMIIGGFVFGLVVGNLAELSKRANPGELMRQKSVSKVASMLHSGAAKVAAPELARRIRAYYSNYYTRRTALDFFGFIVALPTDMRDDLARQMHWIDGVTATGHQVFGLLHKVPFFNELDPLSCIYICGRMKIIQAVPMVREDDGNDSRVNLIMEEGDDADEMFLIIDTGSAGHTIVLEKNGEELCRLGSSDFFGELSALLPASWAKYRRRTRTAYATSETQLGCLSYDDMLWLQSQRFQIAQKVVPYVNAVAAQISDTVTPEPVASVLDAYPAMKYIDAKMDRVLKALEPE